MHTIQKDSGEGKRPTKSRMCISKCFTGTVGVDLTRSLNKKRNDLSMRATCNEYFTHSHLQSQESLHISYSGHIFSTARIDRLKLMLGSGHH